MFARTLCGALADADFDDLFEAAAVSSGFEKHDTSIESALKVCIALLGEPSSRNADEVRWGTHGSKKLILTGEYAGQFNDFEDDEFARSVRRHERSGGPTG